MSYWKRIIIAFYLLLALVVVGLITAGCKEPKHFAPEADIDGKRAVKGCVWFDPGGQNHGGDQLAFCDDGRVCVSEPEWHCIQFAGPKTTTPPPCGEGSYPSGLQPPAEAPPGVR